MSANPEDLSYIHRRCVLVDELVSLEWAHPPYDAEGQYNLPLISVRMHSLRDLAKELRPIRRSLGHLLHSLPFDLGTMELLARIRAADLPSSPIINIEDTPPVTPIEDVIPPTLETEIGSHADVLMRMTG
ncbi:hypothetical protein EW026_g6955 [Hermanssonia centrifuga]|uniref:Uncharacterized protein n=1 Tax=Hermanssonia centrifuga TaxID=98765 RepID=A0A4S4K9K3_9APHY|nr:hypothetical protein EW026_g6955 [Hermanssonia centrifuga]